MPGLFPRLPRGTLTLMREAARHLLRRPLVGVAACARTRDGKWLLVRRGDTGTWGLPGGTLEWGETLATCLARELLEEAGVTRLAFERVVGVYSRPDRDPRFHAVTVAVACEIDPPVRGPTNPLEILERRLFAEEELPEELALGMSDILRAAREGAAPAFE